jgi:hypothetical protein
LSIAEGLCKTKGPIKKAKREREREREREPQYHELNVYKEDNKKI